MPKHPGKKKRKPKVAVRTSSGIKNFPKNPSTSQKIKEAFLPTATRAKLKAARKQGKKK